MRWSTSHKNHNTIMNKKMFYTTVSTTTTCFTYLLYFIRMYDRIDISIRCTCSTFTTLTACFTYIGEVILKSYLLNFYEYYNNLFYLLTIYT